MGEHNSPFYDQGRADGARDTELMSACPGNPPVGPDPDKAWSVMYCRGYDLTFVEGFHVPCDGCKRAS